MVAGERDLKYDDGMVDALLSSGRGGHLISFTPPSVPFTVKKVRIYGVRHPSDKTEFKVQVWDKDQKAVYSADYPAILFPPSAQGAAWVEVTVPDVTVQSDFFIHVYTSSIMQEGIAIGADNSTTNQHSSLTVQGTDGVYRVREGWTYMPGNWFVDKSKVNWMIRVVGQSSP